MCREDPTVCPTVKRVMHEGLSNSETGEGRADSLDHVTHGRQEEGRVVRQQ